MATESAPTGKEHLAPELKAEDKAEIDRMMRGTVHDPVQEGEIQDNPASGEPSISEMERLIFENIGDEFGKIVIDEFRLKNKPDNATIGSKNNAILYAYRSLLAPRNALEFDAGKIIIARARGRMLLSKGEHLQVLWDALDTLHAKDDILKRCILLCCIPVCVKSPKRIRIHNAVVGKSQGGKSHVQLKTVELLPPDRVLKLNSLSAKALYYEAKDNPAFLSEMVLCIDELADNEESWSLLKAMTSNDQDIVTHKTVINQKPVTLRLEGLPVVLANTAEFSEDPRQSAQMFNRWTLGNIDESKECDMAVAAFQSDEDLFGSNNNRNIEIMESAREIIKILMEKKEFDVRIPFSKRLEFNLPNLRINRPKIMNMIRASTYLSWPVRPHYENIYFSTFEDAKFALNIFSTLEGYTTGHIDETAFEILKRIEPNLWNPTSTIISKCKGVSDSTVRRRLDLLCEQGFLDKRERVEQREPVQFDRDGEINAWKGWREDEYCPRIGPLELTKVARKIGEQGWSCQVFSRVFKPVCKDPNSDYSTLVYIYNIIYNIIYNNNNRSFHKIEERDTNRAKRAKIWEIAQKVCLTPENEKTVFLYKDPPPDLMEPDVLSQFDVKTP